MADQPDINDDFRRALLQAVPCAVILLDENRRVTYWNPAADELTGFSADQMLGASCESIQTALRRDVDEGLQASICPFTRGQQWDEECEIRRRDGSIVPVVRKARPVHDATGRQIGSIQTMMDISFIRQARSRIQQLQDEVARLGRFGRLVGSSPAMRRIYETINMVAPTDVPVVIEGETGTGKELIAREIHEKSSRADGPWVVVNGGALPESLIEAELFGHVKGAFTGASDDRMGRFEHASGGTLFLDEVGELPPSVQVKLLRAVQEGEIVRVGENTPRAVDVRLISATNRRLADMVAADEFREDLYYRLRVVEMTVPPLRERGGDVTELVEEFLDQFNRRYNRQIHRLAPAAMEAIDRCDWPGNVRQLRSAIEHAFVVTPADEQTIHRDALPPDILPSTAPSAGHVQHRPPGPLSDAQQVQQIRDALEQTAGNKTRAAELLNLSRAGLYQRIKRLGMSV